MVAFGKTGRMVSAVGLGGEGVLRTYDRPDEAEAVIRAALAQGITYFDSARAYSDSEVYYGRVWGKEPKLRAGIFQTSKSAARDRIGALADLENSLARLRTDYLDLWQIHDVRSEDDLKAIARPGGALEAFLAAKEKGLVKHIGVTGHHDPYVLTRAVAEWPVDSVLLPVNPVEEVLGGFLTLTVPVAKKKGIAIIGMKVLGGSGAHYVLPKLAVTAEMLVRFALARGITLPIVGCATPAEVVALSEAGARPPLPEAEVAVLAGLYRPYAAGMAFYRGVR
ncbi:MAG: aldo/keto reductase [Desulfobulbaceae bacterium]|nr:aldo/keto reductase [Desulfobulbaceae bacterium]